VATGGRDVSVATVNPCASRESAVAIHTAFTQGYEAMCEVLSREKAPRRGATPLPGKRLPTVWRWFDSCGGAYRQRKT
jgi:hypothetical protein